METLLFHISDECAAYSNKLKTYSFSLDQWFLTFFFPITHFRLRPWVQLGGGQGGRILRLFQTLGI